MPVVRSRRRQAAAASAATTAAASPANAAPPRFDEEGRMIYYHPDRPDDPPYRAVLLWATGNKPAVHWQVLDDTLHFTDPVINDLMYFLHASLNKDKCKEAEERIKLLFAMAFPLQEPPLVAVGPECFHCGTSSRNACSKKKCWGTSIRITTPWTNVRASDIQQDIANNSWTVAARPLGLPVYVGIQSSEMLQQIRLKPPQHEKDSFVAALPSIFNEGFDSEHRVEVVDVWEEQRRDSADRSKWKVWFLLVLVRIVGRMPDNGNLVDIVNRWPGWIRWRKDEIVRLDYPGRFDFCSSCEHNAQDLDGPSKRHTRDECRSSSTGTSRRIRTHETPDDVENTARSAASCEQVSQGGNGGQTEARSSKRQRRVQSQSSQSTTAASTQVASENVEDKLASVKREFIDLAIDSEMDP